MQPSHFTICATFLLTGLITISAPVTQAFVAPIKDCHGKVCHPIEQYCSAFSESCDQCSTICDENSHNFNADSCAKQCAEYKKYDPLQAEIHAIQTQQSLILLLLTVLLALVIIRYAYRCIRWCRNKRCFTAFLKKIQSKKQSQTEPNKSNIDGIGGTTIPNVMAIRDDLERAPSQIYSVTGAEGSVMTMTTPISTRYPAENSSSPTTPPAEYSYDNHALAVTPVSEKPKNGTQAF